MYKTSQKRTGLKDNLFFYSYDGHQWFLDRQLHWLDCIIADLAVHVVNADNDLINRIAKKELDVVRYMAGMRNGAERITEDLCRRKSCHDNV